MVEVKITKGEMAAIFNAHLEEIDRLSYDYRKVSRIKY